MPRRTLTGPKIRALRKERGLTQGELARRAGISPAYLSLIEFEKRAAAGALLDRIAAGLGVDRAALDGAGERRVAEALAEVAADPAFAAAAAPLGAVDDLAARHPAWADLVLRLYGAYREGARTVTALADRLNRDPFLGDGVHQVLSSVTAIRSATEILRQDADLGAADRAGFLAILDGESARLSQTARALLAFFDSEATRVRAATPAEHVDAFLLAAENHFPALEAAADDVAAGRRPGERIEAALERRFPQAAAAAALAGAGRPAESRRFDLARRAVEDAARPAVDRLVAESALLGGEEARALAAAALLRYAAAAVLMPYDAALDAAERHRYDVDVLCRLFDVSYEQAAHRLATLARPGASGVRFAFMRSDAAGWVTKRLPLPGLPMPRYSPACPLWPVYAAFRRPGETVAALGELPAGEGWLFFARAVDKPAPPGRRRLQSVQLACAAVDAARTVHADGLDRAAGTLPVGTACRMCPRSACDHRQEPRFAV